MGLKKKNVPSGLGKRASALCFSSNSLVSPSLRLRLQVSAPPHFLPLPAGLRSSALPPFCIPVRLYLSLPTKNHERSRTCQPGLEESQDQNRLMQTVRSPAFFHHYPTLPSLERHFLTNKLRVAGKWNSNRLLADLKVYTQEEVSQTDKIAKMKAANADPYDVKQQVRIPLMPSTLGALNIPDLTLRFYRRACLPIPWLSSRIPRTV